MNTRTLRNILQSLRNLNVLDVLAGLLFLAYLPGKIIEYLFTPTFVMPDQVDTGEIIIAPVEPPTVEFDPDDLDRDGAATMKTDPNCLLDKVVPEISQDEVYALEAALSVPEFLEEACTVRGEWGHEDTLVGEPKLSRGEIVRAFCTPGPCPVDPNFINVRDGDKFVIDFP